MTGGYENPVQVPPTGRGDFWFESFDPNVESFYADSAKELICRIFLNLGAVNLVRMRGYTWSVELGEELYGVIVTGSDAKTLHSMEGATAPLIPSHAREDVQESVTPDRGGYQTLHFAIVSPIRRSCRWPSD